MPSTLQDLPNNYLKLFERKIKKIFKQLLKSEDCPAHNYFEKPSYFEVAPRDRSIAYKSFKIHSKIFKRMYPNLLYIYISYI